MKIESFDDGSKLMAKAVKPALRPDRRASKPTAVAPQLTIAQSIRRSSDPHRAAITSFSRRDCPHGQNKHTYYFEDGSFLTFEVSYMAVEDGGRE
jgi:hypothetical protein